MAPFNPEVCIPAIQYEAHLQPQGNPVNELTGDTPVLCAPEKPFIISAVWLSKGTAASKIIEQNVRSGGEKLWENYDSMLQESKG